MVAVSSWRCMVCHVISTLTMTKIVNISKKNENNALLFGRYIKRDMNEKCNRKRIVVKSLILTTKIEIADGAF